MVNWYVFHHSVLMLHYFSSPRFLVLLDILECRHKFLEVLYPSPICLEPSEFSLLVDGETDKCSMAEDINFELLGFSIYGQVYKQLYLVNQLQTLHLLV